MGDKEFVEFCRTCGHADVNHRTNGRCKSATCLCNGYQPEEGELIGEAQAFCDEVEDETGSIGSVYRIMAAFHRQQSWTKAIHVWPRSPLRVREDTGGRDGMKSEPIKVEQTNRDAKYICDWLLKIPERAFWVNDQGEVELTGGNLHAFAREVLEVAEKAATEGGRRNDGAKR